MARKREGFYREIWQVGGSGGRLISDFFVHVAHGPLHFASAHTSFWPPVDVMETEEGYTVRVEIPGVRQEDLEVTYEGGTLVVRGRREISAPPGARFHQMEIGHGNFERRIRLPGEVDVERIKAKYRDGFLVIHLPRPRPEGKEVSVEVE